MKRHLETTQTQTRFSECEHGAALTKTESYVLHVGNNRPQNVAILVSLSPNLFCQTALEEMQHAVSTGVTPLLILESNPHPIRVPPGLSFMLLRGFFPLLNSYLHDALTLQKRARVRHVSS
jgi:hypothetical protein